MQKTIVMGAGAAVGVVQTVLTRQYDVLIPGIGPYLAGWGRLSTLGNILIGAVALGIPQFTNIVKNTDIGGFLQLYGITAICGGLVNGLSSYLTSAPPSSARVSTLSHGRNGYISPTYYPGFTGRFVDRPATRAQGFGSDVTRNPMAAIPTTIPYNKIIA